MIMTLKEQMQLDFNNIILNTDEFAETSIYTTQDNTEHTISAVWDYEETESEYEIEGEWKKKQAKVLLSKTDINEPQKGDYIRNEEGVEYAVLKTLESDICSHLVHIEEKTRESIGTLLS
jgi:hypothetical protein